MGDFVRQKVVDLSDVADRVLACSRFRTGWPVQWYDAVDAVSSAH